MIMTKKKKLKAILQRLQAGEKLACMTEHGVCYMYHTWDGFAQHHIIKYCSFGSSAVQATVENLKWLLDTICKSKDYEVMTPAELKKKTGRDWFYLF